MICKIIDWNVLLFAKRVHVLARNEGKTLPSRGCCELFGIALRDHELGHRLHSSSRDTWRGPRKAHEFPKSCVPLFLLTYYVVHILYSRYSYFFRAVMRWRELRLEKLYVSVWHTACKMDGLMVYRGLIKCIYKLENIAWYEFINIYNRQVLGLAQSCTCVGTIRAQLRLILENSHAWGAVSNAPQYVNSQVELQHYLIILWSRLDYRVWHS